MSQNTSSAVMQQRQEPSDSFDYYPTQPWATRALLEQPIGAAPNHRVLEPACGEGYMSRPLSEFFDSVTSMDIQDMGYGEQGDYLFPGDDRRFDWTITNPPFRLAEQFIQKALRKSNVGVAMFVRMAFLESIGRYETLFSVTPPTDIFQFTERVPLFRGRVCPSGGTATAYTWLVWRLDLPLGHRTTFRWIPPCRQRLERETDYPVQSTPLASCPLFEPAA
ncbi:MAG: hypothetical protein WBF53_11955 [Litorimonas sp.]